MTGTGIPVMAVTEWDLKTISDGTPGINTLGFNQMIYKDADEAEGSYMHSEVPYGFLTGMQEEEEEEEEEEEDERAVYPA